MTTRAIDIEAEPIDAFEATQEILERAITEGAFHEVVNDSPRHYAIGWGTRMTGARYDFLFFRLGGTTQVEATLEFSGLMGPLLRLIRGLGNGPHLEQILADIKALAESDDFYEDDQADSNDEAADNEDEPPHIGC